MLLNRLSNFTAHEFILIQTAVLKIWIMEFWQSDGEQAVDKHIGSLKTHGELIGECPDTFGWQETTTTCAE